MNNIGFFVNNGATLEMTQEQYDGAVRISHLCAGNEDYDYKISAGEMVMLLNLYKYIKGNNIQNDFINPHGITPRA